MRWRNPTVGSVTADLPPVRLYRWTTVSVCLLAGTAVWVIVVLETELAVISVPLGIELSR